MIIECNYCKANVDAKEISSHESYDPEEPDPFRVTLLECPSCKNTLIGGQYLMHNPVTNKVMPDTPSRLWPQPKKYLSWDIPDGIRNSLEEAQRCFRGGAYIACAAMSGRALEGVCRYFKTKSKYLGSGLTELKNKEIIDKDYLNGVRSYRNIVTLLHMRLMKK